MARPTMKIECDWCGGSREIRVADYNHRVRSGRTRFYCSRSCAAKYGNSIRAPGSYMSDESLHERFWGKVVVQPGSCWLWTAGKDAGGYGSFAVTHRKNMGAHRLAWIMKNGPIPDGMCVLHKCDRRSCVNPAHLFVGTKGDNNTDRAEKGRSADNAGERHPGSVLTVDDVLWIRESYIPYDETFGVAAMARQLGVSPTTVRQAYHGGRWSHIRAGASVEDLEPLSCAPTSSAGAHG